MYTHTRARTCVYRCICIYVYWQGGSLLYFGRECCLWWIVLEYIMDSALAVVDCIW